MCGALFVGAPLAGDYDQVMPAAAAALTSLDRQTRRWRFCKPALAAGVRIATMLDPPALIAALGVSALTVISALTPMLVAGLMVAAYPFDTIVGLSEALVLRAALLRCSPYVSRSRTGHSCVSFSRQVPMPFFAWRC